MEVSGLLTFLANCKVITLALRFLTASKATRAYFENFLDGVKVDSRWPQILFHFPQQELDFISPLFLSGLAVCLFSQQNAAEMHHAGPGLPCLGTVSSTASFLEY
jgi:hypothetical protein